MRQIFPLLNIMKSLSVSYFYFLNLIKKDGSRVQIQTIVWIRFHQTGRDPTGSGTTATPQLAGQWWCKRLLPIAVRLVKGIVVFRIVIYAPSYNKKPN